MHIHEKTSSDKTCITHTDPGLYVNTGVISQQNAGKQPLAHSLFITHVSFWSHSKRGNVQLRSYALGQLASASKSARKCFALPVTPSQNQMGMTK